MILLFLTPGPPRGGRSFASYAGLKLSKNSAPLLTIPSSVGAKTAAKLQLFPLRATIFATFFHLFSNYFPPP